MKSEDELKEIGYQGWFTLEANRYLVNFDQSNVYDGVCALADAAKKLANMFDSKK